MHDRAPNLVYILADDMGYGDLSCLNPSRRSAPSTSDRFFGISASLDMPPHVYAADAAESETVCLVDLLATMSDIHGEELPDDTGEDSVSSLPMWRGGGSRREANVATCRQSTVEALADLLLEGRSTPGPPQSNSGGQFWEQLWWMQDDEENPCP